MNFRVIKENDIFYLSNLLGDSPAIDGRAGETGLFTRDTRVLSRLEWLTVPDALVLLEAESTEGYENRYRYTNRPPGNGSAILRESILVTRYQSVNGIGLFENGTIENYSLEDIRLSIAYIVDADFADMFEVRGFAKPFERQVESRVDEGTCQFTYLAKDERKMTTNVVLRQTELTNVESVKNDLISGTFEQLSQTAYRATLQLTIPSRGTVCWTLSVVPEIVERGVALKAIASSSIDTENVLGSKYEEDYFVRSMYQKWFTSMPKISGDRRFSDWYQQGLKDIRMLQTDLGYGQFLTAGVPWYAVPFGRDSLIAARQMMLASPIIARGTLATLAHFQGNKVDLIHDEQPGKILHEIRDGELSRLDILPFAPYYGSVDSTPLFLILMAEYLMWTGDKAFVQSLMPQVDRALQWIESYGDRDGDGFVEYWREADGGIANQGWKDSGDSVMHKDGALATGPIALAEVQGYVHKAYRMWSRIYSEFGQPDMASHYQSKADALQAAFIQKFYLKEQGIIALALDGNKQPLAVASSNMGQVLYSDILPSEVGKAIAHRILLPDLFNGYGIRTLSSHEVIYNPLSYHNGSVWPHDTSLILSGVRRYGSWKLAAEIVSGLLLAQDSFEYHRLPELFAGFSTQESNRPLPYPVSCSPQAWAAAVPIFVLEQILGIEPDIALGMIRLDPYLPADMNELTVEGIPVFRGHLSIHLVRMNNELAIDIPMNSTGLSITMPDCVRGVMTGN